MEKKEYVLPTLADIEANAEIAAQNFKIHSSTMDFMYYTNGWRNCFQYIKDFISKATPTKPRRL